MNANRVIHATADWQLGSSTLQMEAEIRRKVAVIVDSLPDTARGQFEEFLTNELLEAQAVFSEIDQLMPDVLVEYLPEILEFVRWLSVFT